MSIEIILLYLFNGLLYASYLFLVAAGLQIIFGVLNIINLAIGSFYAIGAYLGIEAVHYCVNSGLPPTLSILALIIVSFSAFVIGPAIEGILRPIYKREVVFQLLLTFGVVLVFEDLIKMIWGLYPKSAPEPLLAYGEVKIGGITYPVYNLMVIAITFIIAAVLGFILSSTKIGIITRATSFDKEISAALGVNVKKVYLQVFTLGTLFGILSGSLMVPIQTAVLGMSVEVIVIAFAVIVIAGLGSIKGALIASIIVGIIRSIGISLFPEIELALIYLIVVIILLIKPSGLFGRVGR